MTKVLFILSAVVMLVATFFAYQNGRQFTNARKATTTAHQGLTKELAAVKVIFEDAQKAKGAVATVQQDVDAENEKLKAQKLRIVQADNETKRTQSELDTQNAKMVSLKDDLTKFPPDMKPETLAEDMNKMKQTIAELNVQAEQKKKDVDAETTKVTDAQKSLDEIAKKIEDRKKSFERNSLSAQIVAVNPDWGFVVVNAGESRGVTEATQLLVVRGTQTVAKLSIISVQGNRTVANIIPESVVGGQSIAPGDRVILEKLYQ